MKKILRSQTRLLTATLALTLTVSQLGFGAGIAFAVDEPVLKAIDTSKLELDDTPTNPASGAFNNTPVQGRPLGNTFQQINKPQDSGFGSGFGSAMTPTIDPIVSAQDEERVNNLEQKAFGCNYHEHEVPDRLDHLEKEVLGSAKEGAIGDRIARLEVKLLGGSGFGGAPSASRNTPPQNPPVASANAGGGDANGNGWLTQPPGTPMLSPLQTPPQSTPQTAPPTQMSGWMTPGQSDGLPPQAMNPAQVNQFQQMLQQQMPQQQMPQQMPPQQQMPQQQQRPPQQMMPQQQMPQQQMPQQMPQQQRPQQIPQQQMPQQQMPQQYAQQPNPNYGRPPVQAARPSTIGLTADASLVANSLFYDVKSGDYLPAIRRFPGQNGQAGQSYAHWRSFPVRLRLPKDSPESWQRALEAVVARWDQYVPVKLALPLEPAPVEVTWVNQLPPKTLGVTRLNIAHGDMRVIVYLLRPSFYPPEIPERTLAGVFMHEVGHALGLFGHSDKTSDLMFPIEIQPTAKGRPATIHFAQVSTRDINTLKKIYESPAVPQGVSLEQPLEWSTTYSDVSY